MTGLNSPSETMRIVELFERLQRALVFLRAHSCFVNIEVLQSMIEYAESELESIENELENLTNDDS